MTMKSFPEPSIDAVRGGEDAVRSDQRAGASAGLAMNGTVEMSTRVAAGDGERGRRVEQGGGNGKEE